jgi:hypothetical protein
MKSDSVLGPQLGAADSRATTRTRSIHPTTKRMSAHWARPLATSRWGDQRFNPY